MEKEFIPYEQALELKELGFNEKCYSYYTKDQEFFYFDVDDFSSSYTKNLDNLKANSVSELVCTAPLWQQVAQFLYLNSNKQINFQINGSDSNEELCKKLKKSIQDFRDLQNNKS